ncbi:MAG TPA: hypothetical protein VFK85_04975 [Anaeromyxobacteraceae bacterium]|nr:hypothetical protein [Anaeromyxobacteraceae bacterium]
MNVAAARSRGGEPSSSPPPPADSFGAALRRGASERRCVERGQRATGVQRRTETVAGEQETATTTPWAQPRSLLLAVGSEAERLPLAAAASAHRVALAIDVLRAGERGRVEIGLHPGAALQLDAARDGIALLLTVSPPFARSAAAELPALVEALRQRGVAVSRAEVRVGPQRRGRDGRAR